jgi:hypothetical protein
MTRFTLSLCALLLVANLRQIPKGNWFSIRVTRVENGSERCTALVESATVRFHLSSDQAATCTILRADESYPASRATTRSQGDESSDKPILIIKNNLKSGENKMYAFDIVSEEVTKGK